jgi:hypothetical protein
MSTPILAVERPNMTVLQLPAGAAVTLLDDRLCGNRLVDVTWNGRDVMIFGRDIHQCREIT